MRRENTVNLGIKKLQIGTSYSEPYAYYNKFFSKVKLLVKKADYRQLFRKLFLFYYVNLLPYSAFILGVLTPYLVFLVTVVNIIRRNM